MEQIQHNSVLSAREAVASQTLFFSCIWAVKMGFMVFYRNLFWVSKRFRVAWWAVLVFVLLAYLVCVVSALTQCGKRVAASSGMYCIVSLSTDSLFPKFVSLGCSHGLVLEMCSSLSSNSLHRTTFIYTTTVNIASDIASEFLCEELKSAIYLRYWQSCSSPSGCSRVSSCHFHVKFALVSYFL